MTNLQLSKREELAQYLEQQADFNRKIADMLRSGENASDYLWTIDLFTTDEWAAEMAAIEGQEKLQYEHVQAIERGYSEWNVPLAATHL